MAPNPGQPDVRLRNTYEDLVQGARMYLKDLDLQRGVGTLVPMTPANYSTSSFLDSRIATDSDTVFDLPLDVLLQMAPWFAQSRRPMHFIFHIGHCGSTLLSRLLGGLPGFFSLREPAPLRTLTDYAAPGRPLPGGWEASLMVVLGLLSRVFDDRDTAIIKPSSFCNRLIPTLMGWHPACRAVLLYIDLPAYLAAMTKETSRRETDTALASYHLAEIRHLLGDKGFAAPPAPGLEAAALVWLMSLVHFRAVMRHPTSRDRVKTVRFDDLLADPARILAACGSFLGGRISSADVERLATDPAAVGTYSKGMRQAYGARERAAELDQARAVHKGGIDAAIRFAKDISGRNPAFAAALADFGGV